MLGKQQQKRQNHRTDQALIKRLLFLTIASLDRLGLLGSAELLTIVSKYIMPDGFVICWIIKIVLCFANTNKANAFLNGLLLSQSKK